VMSPYRLEIVPPSRMISPSQNPLNHSPTPMRPSLLHLTTKKIHTYALPALRLFTPTGASTAVAFLPRSRNAGRSHAESASATSVQLISLQFAHSASARRLSFHLPSAWVRR
jgi:hypothetical protein